MWFTGMEVNGVMFVLKFTSANKHKVVRSAEMRYGLGFCSGRKEAISNTEQADERFEADNGLERAGSELDNSAPSNEELLYQARPSSGPDALN